MSATRTEPASPTRESVLVGLVRTLGVVAGAVVGRVVARHGSLGVGLTLAPAAFGLCVLLATVVGETVVRPRRAAGPRVASLAPRRVRVLMPRGMRMVGVGVGGAVATMLLTTLTAAPDPVTGGLRRLACTAAGVSTSHSPYPGSFYTGPLAVLLAVVLAVSGLAARAVVRRPRGLGGTEQHDEALRRRSLEVVLAATGVAVAAPMFGVALVAGGAMRSLGTARPSCAPGWMAPVGLVLLVAALAYLVLACSCAARLLGGTARVPVAEQ